MQAVADEQFLIRTYVRLQQDEWNLPRAQYYRKMYKQIRRYRKNCGSVKAVVDKEKAKISFDRSANQSYCYVKYIVVSFGFEVQCNNS